MGRAATCCQSACSNSFSSLPTSVALPFPVADITFARGIICLAKCLPNLILEEENIHVLIKLLLPYVSGAEGNRKRVCV